MITIKDTTLSASIRFGGTSVSYSHESIGSLSMDMGREEMLAAVKANELAVSKYFRGVLSTKMIDEKIILPIAECLNGWRSTISWLRLRRLRTMVNERDDLLVGAKAIARKFRVPQKTIWRLYQQGKLPDAYKLANAKNAPIRMNESDVRKLMEG